MGTMAVLKTYIFCPIYFLFFSCSDGGKIEIVDGDDGCVGYLVTTYTRRLRGGSCFERRCMRCVSRTGQFRITSRPLPTSSQWDARGGHGLLQSWDERGGRHGLLIATSPFISVIVDARGDMIYEVLQARSFSVLVVSFALLLYSVAWSIATKRIRNLYNIQQ